MLTRGLTSSGFGGWRTPPEVLERVRRVGPIALDPCAARDGLVGAAHEWYGGAHVDGLAMCWDVALRGVAYVNPPYGREIGAWTRKCREESRRGVEVVALLPARTDTAWWHESCALADAACFLRGRVKFISASGRQDGVAPFPSAVVYWGRDVAAFSAAFGDAGMLVPIKEWTR